MTYIVVQFDYNNRNGMYEKLLRVFEQSVKENDPNSDMVVKRVNAPKVKGKQCFSSNTLKLQIWVQEMKKLPEGHQICFIDCDMMVLKPSDDVFENDFDICYTKRPRPQNSRLPVNGGVVFCKNNERSRAFMSLWSVVNDKMYHDQKFHARWRKKYAGMNQSAFGYLMEHPKEYNAKLFGVECNTYNVCNESWHNVGKDNNIRIVHIKSNLRRIVTSGNCDKTNLYEAAKIWVELYKRSGGNPIELKVSNVGFKTKRNGVLPGQKKIRPGQKRKGLAQNKPMKEIKEDETIHSLIGRKSKRRLHIP